MADFEENEIDYDEEVHVPREDGRVEVMTFRQAMIEDDLKTDNIKDVLNRYFELS